MFRQLRHRQTKGAANSRVGANITAPHLDSTRAVHALLYFHARRNMVAIRRRPGKPLVDRSTLCDIEAIVAIKEHVWNVYPI